MTLENPSATPRYKNLDTPDRSEPAQTYDALLDRRTDNQPAGRIEAGSTGRAADDGGFEGSDSSDSSDRELPDFDLSTTKIVAGTAAAATAAYLGSGLGVAGTIVGAALGSLISITMAAVYTHTLVRASRRMRSALHGIPRQRALLGNAGRRSPALRTGQSSGPHDARSSAPRNPLPRPQQPARRFRLGTFRLGTARIGTVSPRTLLAGAGAAAIVFVATLALITGVESVTGQPLSGGSAGGLTVLGGGSTGTPDRTEPDDGQRPADGDAPVTSEEPSGSAEATDPHSSTTPTDAADEPAGAAVPTDATDGPSGTPAASSSAPPTGSPATSAAPTTDGTTAETSAPQTTGPTTTDGTDPTPPTADPTADPSAGEAAAAATAGDGSGSPVAPTGSN